MRPRYLRFALRTRRLTGAGTGLLLLTALVAGWIRYVPGELALELFGWHVPIRQLYLVFLALLAGTGLLVYSTYRHGRVYCSWLCGYHQLLELRMGRRLRVLRAAVAAGACFGLSWSIGLFLTDQPFWSLPSLQGTVLALCVLAALLSALFGYRARFCRSACPYGMMQILLRGPAPLRVRFHADRCTNCRRCESACPMNLNVRAECSGAHCTNCTRCIAACAAELGAGREALAMTAEPLDDQEERHDDLADS